jgi:hypothetical protein
MARYRADLFKSAKAGADDRWRNVGTLDDMRKAIRAVVQHDTRAWVEITYQPAGQGHKRRTVYTPAGAEAAVRYAIEAETGHPVLWRVRVLTYGRKDSLNLGKLITYPTVGESSATTPGAALLSANNPASWTPSRENHPHECTPQTG